MVEIWVVRINWKRCFLRFWLCELTATFNIGSKNVFFQFLRWWFGEVAVHQTTIQHNNGVYAFWAPFWLDLWWFELIADTMWWFWQSKLTAPFILAENAFLGERFLTVIQKCIQNRSKKIGSLQMFHFVTQYCELRHETIRTGQPTIPAFRCVKNQLATRSGSIYTGKSLSEVFKWFSGPQKVLKTL